MCIYPVVIVIVRHAMQVNSYIAVYRFNLLFSIDPFIMINMGAEEGENNFPALSQCITTII